MGLDVPCRRAYFLPLSGRRGVMIIAVLSLFPEAIRPYLEQSILGQAEKKGLVRLPTLPCMRVRTGRFISHLDNGTSPTVL